MTSTLRLQAVTKLLLDRDLGALQAVQTEENKLRGELAALRHALEQRAANTPSDVKIAYALSGEQQWVVWVDARIKALNIQLAHLLARKSYLRDAAARSLGRDSALAALVSREKQKAQHRKSAREHERLLDLRIQSSPKRGTRWRDSQDPAISQK